MHAQAQQVKDGHYEWGKPDVHQHHGHPGPSETGREACDPGWAWAVMVSITIWLSPLAVAVFYLLGLGMLYHLYLAFLACHFVSFMLGGPVAPSRGDSSLNTSFWQPWWWQQPIAA